MKMPIILNRNLFKFSILLLVLVVIAGTPAGVFSQTVPQRIISLAPSFTEELFLLGAEGQLKGCTNFCIRPEAAKRIERVGTVVNFNLEKILSIKPDLILASEFAEPKAIEKLKKLGYRVEVIHSPKGFNDLCESLLWLGKLVGRESNAKTMISNYRNEVESIKQKVGGSKKVRVFLQLGTKPLVVSTKHSFTNDYIEFAGGVSITAEAKNLIYNREDVLKGNPEVICIVSMGMLAENEKLSWKTFSSMDAVKSNRIYILDAYQFCNPTPGSFVNSLRQMANILHPEKMKTSNK